MKWVETWALLKTIEMTVGSVIAVGVLIWFLWSTRKEVNGK